MDFASVLPSTILPQWNVLVLLSKANWQPRCVGVHLLSQHCRDWGRRLRVWDQYRLHSKTEASLGLWDPVSEAKKSQLTINYLWALFCASAVLSCLLKLCDKFWSFVGSLNPPIFLKIVLVILGPLHFHMNFRIGLSIYAKKAGEILIGITNLDPFRKYCIITV
jgi:hypothetical protein